MLWIKTVYAEPSVNWYSSLEPVLVPAWKWGSGTKAGVVLCSSLVLGFFFFGLVPGMGQQLITGPCWVTLEFKFPFLRHLLMCLIPAEWAMLKAFPVCWLLADGCVSTPVQGHRGVLVTWGDACSRYCTSCVLCLVWSYLTEALNCMVCLNWHLSLIWWWVLSAPLIATSFPLINSPPNHLSL